MTRMPLPIVLAVLLLGAAPVASVAAPAPALAPVLAAASPFERSDDADETPTGATAADGSPADSASADAGAAGAAPAAARLDAVIATLRRSALSVDPELAWIFDARTRARLERTLERSAVPILVAILPLLDEDESGGDGDRVLRALQQGVGRDAAYVVVDQRGRFSLASIGIRRSLEIPYGLLNPPYDRRPIEEQVDDPAPPGWASIADRLGTIVETAEASGPGEPNGLVRVRSALDPLDRTDYAAERRREDAIFGVVAGVFGGIVLGLLFLGVRGGIRAARDQPRSGRGNAGGGRGTRPGGRRGRNGRRGRRPRG